MSIHLFCTSVSLFLLFRGEKSTAFVSEVSRGCFQHISGRTDAEAEAPILRPPDVNSQIIGKDSDAGKDRSQEEKGTTEDEMVGWHH